MRPIANGDFPMKPFRPRTQRRARQKETGSASRNNGYFPAENTPGFGNTSRETEMAQDAGQAKVKKGYGERHRSPYKVRRHFTPRKGAGQPKTMLSGRQSQVLEYLSRCPYKWKGSRHRIAHENARGATSHTRRGFKSRPWQPHIPAQRTIRELSAAPYGLRRQFCMALRKS